MHTHTKITHAFTVTTVLLGMLFIFSGTSSGSFQAQITGQGSRLFHEETPMEDLILDAGTFHAAPTVFVSHGQTSSVTVLILGTFLVFLGLAVHALIVLRKHSVMDHAPLPHQKRFIEAIRL